MKTKLRSNSPNKHYLVTTIRDGEMDQTVATRAERQRLDPNDAGVQIDESKGTISIKHKGSTKSTTYRPGEMPGLGVCEWNLLADIVFSAGDILLLESNPCINQRVRRIRRLFHDSKDAEWFFKTSRAPYAIAINTDLTWRYVETLAEADPKVTETDDA